MTDSHQVTLLLQRIQSGDGNANGQLFELIHSVLRSRAGALMQRERSNHTLQPSALVNEAVVRMLKDGVPESAPNRRYLFRAANVAMQRVLIEHWRKRSTEKRGGGLERQPMDLVIDSFEHTHTHTFAELHEALELLEKDSERQVEVIRHRFFAGLQVSEIAALMDCSIATVKRELLLARTKLQRWLTDSGG